MTQLPCLFTGFHSLSLTASYGNFLETFSPLIGVFLERPRHAFSFLGTIAIFSHFVDPMSSRRQVAHAMSDVRFDLEPLPVPPPPIDHGSGRVSIINGHIIYSPNCNK
jgi:hypothetical protein